jgi:hypothetical protein
MVMLWLVSLHCVAMPEAGRRNPPEADQTKGKHNGGTPPGCDSPVHTHSTELGPRQGMECAVNRQGS